MLVIFAFGVDDSDRLEVTMGLETDPDRRHEVVQKTPWLRRSIRQVLLFVGTASLLFVLSLASRYIGDARVSLGFTNTAASMVTAYRPPAGTASAWQWEPAKAAVDAVEAIPGIRRAASMQLEPLAAPDAIQQYRRNVVGRPELADTPFYGNAVTAGYFSTLGIELLAGRAFDAEKRNEVVVSLSAAETLGGVEAVLGSPLVTSSQFDGESETTVVGVVGDAPYGGYAGLGNRVVYSPMQMLFNQQKWLVDADPTVDVADALRQSPGFAGWEITHVGTPESVFREQFLARRSVEIVLSVAAAFALLLALAGVANSLARSMAITGRGGHRRVHRRGSQLAATGSGHRTRRLHDGDGAAWHVAHRGAGCG